MTLCQSFLAYVSLSHSCYQTIISFGLWRIEEKLFYLGYSFFVSYSFTSIDFFFFYVGSVNFVFRNVKNGQKFFAACNSVGFNNRRCSSGIASGHNKGHNLFNKLKKKKYWWLAVATQFTAFPWLHELFLISRHFPDFQQPSCVNFFFFQIFAMKGFLNVDNNYRQW